MSILPSMPTRCPGMTCDAITALLIRPPLRRPRVVVKTPAALGDAIEERADLAVQELHIGRKQACGRGVAGDAAGRNRLHRHVGNVLSHLDRLELRIEQIL